MQISGHWHSLDSHFQEIGALIEFQCHFNGFVVQFCDLHTARYGTTGHRIVTGYSVRQGRQVWTLGTVWVTNKRWIQSFIWNTITITTGFVYSNRTNPDTHFWTLFMGNQSLICYLLDLSIDGDLMIHITIWTYNMMCIIIVYMT